MARLLMLLLAGIGFLVSSMGGLPLPMALLVGAAGGGFGWFLGGMRPGPGGRGGAAAGFLHGDGGAYRHLPGMLDGNHHGHGDAGSGHDIGQGGSE